MPENTKRIKGDAQGRPIPQYFNPDTDLFEALEGADGAALSLLVGVSSIDGTLKKATMYEDDDGNWHISTVRAEVKKLIEIVPLEFFVLGDSATNLGDEIEIRDASQYFNYGVNVSEYDQFEVLVEDTHDKEIGITLRSTNSDSLTRRSLYYWDGSVWKEMKLITSASPDVSYYVMSSVFPVIKGIYPVENFYTRILRITDAPTTGFLKMTLIGRKAIV